jgi:hypothetical protein
MAGILDSSKSQLARAAAAGLGRSSRAAAALAADTFLPTLTTLSFAAVNVPFDSPSVVHSDTRGRDSQPHARAPPTRKQHRARVLCRLVVAFRVFPELWSTRDAFTLRLVQRAHATPDRLPRVLSCSCLWRVCQVEPAVPPGTRADSALLLEAPPWETATVTRATTIHTQETTRKSSH